MKNKEENKEKIEKVKKLDMKKPVIKKDLVKK